LADIHKTCTVQLTECVTCGICRVDRRFSGPYRLYYMASDIIYMLSRMCHIRRRVFL